MKNPSRRDPAGPATQETSRPGQAPARRPDTRPPDGWRRIDCGDLDIRIDRDGTWFYQGSPIHRKELVCLFASVLERDENGVYWLSTPAERGRIAVEDAPFLAVELFVHPGGRDQVLSFRTNVDELVTLDEAHPLRVSHDPETGEPTPYIRVRDGLEARIERSVYYELVALGMEEKIGEENLYGVWSNVTFFPLGRLEIT